MRLTDLLIQNWILGVASLYFFGDVIYALILFLLVTIYTHIPHLHAKWIRRWFIYVQAPFITTLLHRSILESDGSILWNTMVGSSMYLFVNGIIDDNYKFLRDMARLMMTEDGPWMNWDDISL